ncbi:glycosyltransferase [Flavivirga abyssicola]|uniref:glycosyltransferase n=1 Tax=Flavivirga abyssicola TaxID=3063533 RepID=UPI0026E0A8B8|nr:glycosyltransferase [Flavivirga sp. MEBiC07777]WVK12042.1 glycosyltransferase [Flavivirga sp. MEBiC07777]
MKILLVGEYSRLHNSLKEGLIKNGHQVILVASGDGFKKFPADINFKVKYNKGVMSLLKKIMYRVFSIDIASISTKAQFNAQKDRFKNFDVVQLINENSFSTLPKIEKQILSFIFKHNPNVFLLSCGTDYTSVKYAHDKNFRYSILTPYFENKVSKKKFKHILMRISNPYYDLHKYIHKNITGCISSDLDYHIPLINNDKYLGLAPNPINIDKLKHIDLCISSRIVIFHGINEDNYYKKGNDIFEKALDFIVNKYADKVEIVTVKSLPYNEYIKAFDSAHIVLDQVYAYDQGYNALEAMAKGKVVFTGAENEWLEYYNLKEDTVAINALPDADKIIEKLEWLIFNPDKIIEISKNARAFIEKEHNYLKIADNYVLKWTGKS